eukprot:67381-Rhodomonas_salina.1
MCGTELRYGATRLCSSGWLSLRQVRNPPALSPYACTGHVGDARTDCCAGTSNVGDAGTDNVWAVLYQRTRRSRSSSRPSERRVHVIQSDPV